MGKGWRRQGRWLRRPYPTASSERARLGTPAHSENATGTNWLRAEFTGSVRASASSERETTETLATRLSARPLDIGRPRGAGARHGAEEIDFALRNISGNTQLLAGMRRAWPSRTASRSQMYDRYWRV